jgi:hypothetical protein
MVPYRRHRPRPELTQAAFVKTYLAWHKIDPGRALSCARRCLVNHKIDAVTVGDDRDDLVRRLSRLPEQQRRRSAAKLTRVPVPC